MIDIKQYKISDLLPRMAEDNPRYMPEEERDALKGSLSISVVEPAIVNLASGRIVGGHQRISCAAEIGLEEFPVVEVTLSEDEEVALRIGLNEMKGELDDAAVSRILAEIDGSSEADRLLTATGYGEDETAILIDAYLESLEEEADAGMSFAQDSFAPQQASRTKRAMISVNFGRFNYRLEEDQYEQWLADLRQQSARENPVELGLHVAGLLGIGQNPTAEN